FSESSFILLLLSLNIRIIIFSRTYLYRQNLLVRDASPRDFSSLQTESSRQGCIAPGFFIPADRISSAGIHGPGIFIPADRISSSGMHRPRIFHPCRQNFLVRDASPQDFSSLQTKFPRQGCIVPGFFILADRIFSAGMHRPGIFHLYRQNLLGRDASPQDFSSLQTESPRQGCIVSAIMPQACRAPPQSAELTSIHLNACRAYPDKAGSSDFQTAGFHSR
ncbi:MAG: hypothetical protein SOS94_02320, partial [Lachnospiraceae bacterium]|nr:hypothetical protein [Lachnospiraceae bacterium]